MRKLKYQDGVAMGYTIVLPAKYQFEVMNAAHDGAGHFGNKKTLDQFVMKFNWPGMKRDLEQYVQSCPACQKGKPNAKSKPHALKPIISERPNQLVQIAFLKLNESSEGHKGFILNQRVRHGWIRHYFLYKQMYYEETKPRNCSDSMMSI